MLRKSQGHAVTYFLSQHKGIIKATHGGISQVKNTLLYDEVPDYQGTRP